MHVGQVIAIDVLDRHVKTSSGKCAVPTPDNYSESCVMADALRDRFKGATEVEVGGGGGAHFRLPDGTYVYLQGQDDMNAAISTFDSVVEEFKDGKFEFKYALNVIRQRIPRVVHARVTTIVNDD